MSIRNPIQGPSYLDPLFPIPEGLVDYKYSDVIDTTVPDYLTEEGGGDLGSTEVENEDYITEDGDEELEFDIDVPSTFVVISQTIRTLPSGMQVVDVVAEVEDIPGALNYEFRVVKK